MANGKKGNDTYYATGRYEEAAGLHGETLEARQRVLGLKHPRTRASRQRLAEARRAAGSS